MTKLYHTDIFIPEKFQTAARTVQFAKLVWSRHAQLELINDRYGMVPRSQIPGAFRGQLWQLVELEITGGVETKYVFRRPVDETRSLVIVLRPDTWLEDAAVVVTCWTNRNYDTHKTLDRSKYATS